MSAMAVEIIVFGELYDNVMEEIKNATRDQDKGLECKLSGLKREAEAAGVETDTHISEEALRVL